MKKMSKKTALAVLMCLFILPCFSQTYHDFENLSLPADSFWNGSDLSGGFDSWPCHFSNNFVDWGSGITSWDGFAYSNMYDDSTQAFANMYSCYAGHNTQGIHALTYLNIDWMTNEIVPNYIRFLSHMRLVSLKVTNTTYTALTMRNGDAFSKKFGGTSGDDPDWFKLSIVGYNEGVASDTIDFFLADYRFSNNNDDYIIKEWTSIDLTSIDIVDSVAFFLTSSDNGIYGMNTPALFCFDELVLDYVSSAGNLTMAAMKPYPNPAGDCIILEGYSGGLSIYSTTGQLVKTHYINERADISDLRPGTYILQAGKQRTVISKL